jgi:hypothetical protein
MRAGDEFATQYRPAQCRGKHVSTARAFAARSYESSALRGAGNRIAGTTNGQGDPLIRQFA